MNSSARTFIEFTEEQRFSALAAFKKVHGVDADLGLAPDRAWLEGYLSAQTISAPPPAGAQQAVASRYSFVCNAGCGVCAVKVTPFEYERTETLEGEHLGSKYRPHIVSSCCGSEVHVYDNDADDWGAAVTISATPAPEAAPSAKEGEADMYLLQDSRSFSYVGNCPTWWKQGGGYTTRIDEAERFTLAKAMAQHRSRDTDIPWASTEIEPLQRPTIDLQDLPRSNDAQRAALKGLTPAGGDR